MFDQYCVHNGVSDRVSRRTFYRLAGVLTHSEMQARRAVDYVTGFLVHDNFAVLKRIIRELLPDVSHVILPKLSILQEWLKYGSGFDIDDEHESDCSRCPRHQVVFGLALPKNDSIEARPVCCGPCLAMRALLDDIEDRMKVSGVDDSTLAVLQDSYAKMELFLGHRIRVRNQQRALHAAADAMKSTCNTEKFSDEAILILDFKMKLEPLYYREKTVDHYGKRGMSWHGALLRYWTFDEDLGEAEETKLYFDQICNTDNKQDKEAVIALVEALLLSLRREVPQITRLTVQSDNASSYQNPFVGLMLPLIGAAHGLDITRYVHSDTQDGKSMLDAHFATAARKVKAWVRQGNNCVTPSQVVMALTGDGGLPNCVAELVEYDRSTGAELYKQVKSMERSLAKCIDRANDIFYDFPSTSISATASSPDNLFDVRACPSFQMRVFSYSNIGEGINISVDPSNSTCTLRTELSSPNNSENGYAPVFATRSVQLGQNCNTGDEAPVEQSITPDPITESADDIQRRLCFDSNNEEGYCHEAVEDETTSELDIGGIAGLSDDSADSEDEEDDVSTHDQEIILPHDITGFVTGIRITTKAQIRRRARKRCRLVVPSSSRTGNADVFEKDVEAYAKRSILELKIGGDFGTIIERAGLAAKMRTIADGCSASRPTMHSLVIGWAQRPKRGAMYGAKYVALYENEIEEMFRRGEKQQTQKLGPARMLDALIAMNPHRYNLPGENEIRGLITRLMSRRRRIAPPPDFDSMPNVSDPLTIAPVKRWRRMEPKYACFLADVVAENPLVKPMRALTMLYEHFPGCQSNTDKKQILNKVSALKRKSKLAASLSASVEISTNQSS